MREVSLTQDEIAEVLTKAQTEKERKYRLGLTQSIADKAGRLNTLAIMGRIHNTLSFKGFVSLEELEELDKDLTAIIEKYVNNRFKGQQC